MTTEQKIIKTKVGLLELAKQPSCKDLPAEVDSEELSRAGGGTGHRAAGV